MMYEQPVMAIDNAQVFGKISSVLDQSFGPAAVEGFLKNISRKGLRVRDFAAVLSKGLLGKETPAAYHELSDNDRGQVRELYLTRVEQVPAGVREKYFRIYAYY